MGLDASIVLTIEHGGAVARVRRSLGLTQTQLAMRAKCSRTSVALIEAGYLPQRSQVLGRIVDALNDVEPVGNGLDVKEGDDTAHASTG